MPINLLQRTINDDPTNAIIPGNLTVTGILSVTGATHMGGAVTMSSTLAVTGAATFTSSIAAASLALTGAATIGTTLGVTGAATFSSTIGVTGIATASRFQESAGTTTVTANTSYVVLSTDRYILISTTGAGGPFTITFPSIAFISRVTIRMTAFNTSSYTAAGVSQGTVTWGAANSVATFISPISSATWSLAGAPQPTTMV